MTASPVVALAPTDASKVVVFRDESLVDRPIEKVGIIRYTAVNMSNADLEAMMKRKAAAIGAHGVIRKPQSAVLSGPFFAKKEQVDGWAQAVRFPKRD